MDIPKWLPNIVLFIGLILISLNFAYIVYIPEKYKNTMKETVFNDSEAVENYRKLLMYIKNKPTSGIKIVEDFNKRIEGFPESFRPYNIMKDFKNPLL